MPTHSSIATADQVVLAGAVLERLAHVEIRDQGSGEVATLLRQVARMESMLAAFKLRAVAHAEQCEAALGAGLADTGQWVARMTNVDPVVASREAGLAQGLRARSATQAALASGDLSAEHARVIVGAAAQLPADVTPEQCGVIERALIEKATLLSPGLLRRHARRALEALEVERSVVDAHENAVLIEEEDAARAKARLSLHDNDDGTVSGRFTVPTAQGDLLHKILQTMTAPRRGRLGASQAQGGSNTGLRTDWERARSEAFCELLDHLPTDRLTPRTAATIVVTMTAEALQGALQAAHLDTGADISAGEARRLLCNASILPAVLGGASIPLDLGRSARLFNEAQRTAVGLRQDSCAADGCDRPVAWSELHHRDPWGQGGATDLANAVAICHFHHQRVHDPRYEHVYRPRGITFHRRQDQSHPTRRFKQEIVA